ncbi:MAG: (d)CMP kinase [Rickettsiales bacterium]|nr:MAG: (d)CMP kinase [Rickettsiales bacterium]
MILKKIYDKEQKFVLALDGPSASGKGLIGSMIAKEFDLKYFQSSLVYRGLAYICIQDKLDIRKPEKLIKLIQDIDIFSRIKDVDLSSEEIGSIASKISVISEVREKLGIYLKNIIQVNSRVIMEGRDIGTVIAPSADLKIYITADVNIRANRRYKQLCESGKSCILSDILNQLKIRDERDLNRDIAPLVQASDAYLIDTSYLSPDEVIQKIKTIIDKSV